MNVNINIFNHIKNLDKKIIKIMKSGIIFSFYFCIFASIILVTYNFYKTPLLFHIGISLFQSGLFFIVSFVIYGFAFNKISNEI